MRGHAPLYPAYTTPAPERTLAYYTPREGIVTEHNKRLAIPSDLSTLRNILWTENLLLFVDNIASFPLLPEIIYDYPNSEVTCTSKGETIGIKLKGPKNSTRWIIDAARWGYSVDRDLLSLLRSLFDYCAVGHAKTPGGLGAELERRTYKEHTLTHHTRPHGGALDLIRTTGAGGRVDTPCLDPDFQTLYHYDVNTIPMGSPHFESLMELDMKGAYNAHYGKHPTGTSVRLITSTPVETEQSTLPDSAYCTWYGECIAHIRHTPLRLGPFPVRSTDSTLTYPTEPGDYQCWLWREQAEDLLKLGGSVTFIEGWGWKEWTENGMHYAAVMECLRREAPTPEIASLIKKATVAGIGRHAMGKCSYLLVPPEHATKGDVAVGGSENGQAIAYNWYVHAFADPHNTNMLHWNSYTVMQCARTLFKKAYEYAERGALVATNYDAIYLSLWRYEELALPEKGSPEDNAAASGTWRQRILYDVDIPAPRSITAITADGERYIKRPGVHQEDN